MILNATKQIEMSSSTTNWMWTNVMHAVCSSHIWSIRKICSLRIMHAMALSACVCVCWEVERNQLTSKRLFLYRRRRKTWISHLGTGTENSQRSFNSIYSSDGKFVFDSVLSSPWVRDTITNCLFLLHHKFLAVKNEQNNSARWKRVTPPKGMKILRKQLLCNGISA